MSFMVYILFLDVECSDPKSKPAPFDLIHNHLSVYALLTYDNLDVIIFVKDLAA